MKIAICLSGQPRSFLSGYPYIVNQLLSRNKNCEFQFFIHTWESKVTNDYIKLFAPKLSYVERPFVHGDEHSRYSFENTYAEAYSVLQSDLLRLRYETLNGFNFDFVIKSRTDFAISVAIDFSTLQTDKIYFTDIGHIGEILHPCFIIANSSNMEILSQYATHVKRCPKNWSTEDILVDYLKKVGLFSSIVLFHHPLPFPPGLYNSTPHALLRDDMEYWLGSKK